MERNAPKGDELLLIEASMLLQSLLLGSFDRKNINCTKTQLVIFLALSRYGPLNMSQIAGYIAASNEQATRAVAPLVNAGLAERFNDPENRTRVYVRLTPKGQRCVTERSQDIVEQIDERLNRSVNEEERLQLCQAAETIIKIAGKVH